MKKAVVLGSLFLSLAFLSACESNSKAVSKQEEKVNSLSETLDSLNNKYESIVLDQQIDEKMDGGKTTSITSKPSNRYASSDAQNIAAELSEDRLMEQLKELSKSYDTSISKLKSFKSEPKSYTVSNYEKAEASMSELTDQWKALKNVEYKFSAPDLLNLYKEVQEKNIQLITALAELPNTLAD